MGEFRMPSLGADMDAGRVVEWLAEPGDHVEKGDLIAVVDTDKADVEIEVFESGTLQEILVPVGEKVPVGTVLAIIDGVGGTGVAPSAAPETEEAEAESPPSEPPPSAEPAPVPAPATHGQARVSPRARRLAEDLGVDLAGVVGTGRDGEITGDDVERAAQPAAAPGTTDDQAATMRRAIGAVMARSKREIPHYYLATDIDMTAATEWLRAANEERPVAERLLPAVLLLKAVALAAREVPEMNGFWVDDAFSESDHVHLGVAVSLRQGGLLAPAIHDADRLDLGELMGALRDLVNRARAGRLRRAEMADPTITVTNLGDQGVDAVYGVIYPPQVALVGFGTVAERPWAADGVVESRPVVKASLSADHRASDGHRGGVFLNAVARRLEEPESL